MEKCAERLLRYEQLENRRLLSLTHHYTFNDGTGTDLVGTASIALVNGASVNAGAVVLENEGVISGDANNIEYLSLPTSALPSMGSMTVEVWFTRSSTASWMRVFDIGSQSSGSGDSYLYFTPKSSSNVSRLSLSPGGGPANQRTAESSLVSQNQQHLVSAVIDSANDTLLLYLDAVEVATEPLRGADVGSIVKSVAYFGRSLFDDNQGFTGEIDEIRIYDDARLATEIATTYAAGPVPVFDPLENLTHWYPFTEDASDLIGGVDITLEGGAEIYAGQAVLDNRGVTSGSPEIEYLNLPTSALPSSDSVTIEVWFAAASQPSWTRVLDIGNQTASATGDSYLYLTPHSGGGVTRLVLSPGGGPANGRNAEATFDTDDAAKHMVAAVVDSSTDELKLFVDGELVATQPLAGADLGSITKSVAYFGRSLWDENPGLTGTFDEIRIYDAARADEAIAEAYERGPVPNPDPYPEDPVRFSRQVEHLNRAILAVRRSSNSVYVGWRMLGTDPANVAFDLYRSTNGAQAVKLNGSPITATTDYVDNSASNSNSYEYFVRPIFDGVVQAASEPATVPAFAPVQQYLEVPLQIPAGGVTPSGNPYTYSANDASVGDVDGDGEYEIILKWDPSNSKDNAQAGYSGNVYLDAYEMDGTQLWRIDLGVNIRAGAHYTQFMVYDLDGDGKAEVALKTAEGSRDGQGNYIANDPAKFIGDFPTSVNNAADHRNSGGYIRTGYEFLTIFEGETGSELATTFYNPPRNNNINSSDVSAWGDGYGNRVDRFLAGVAYLDGVRPSLIMARGYYTRSVIAAYDWREGQLTERWVFDSDDPGNEGYGGQGNHQLSIADVDGDGFDEIIYGAMTVNHDGTGLYTTGLGHGDALHVTDMDPTNPGLEIFQPHESPGSFGAAGAGLRDALTGELLVAIPASSDVGRGVAADIDPNSPGFEMWATTNGSWNVHDLEGEPLYGTPGNMFYNFVVWWDADLTRELLDGTTISNWHSPGRSNFDLDPATGGTQQYALGSSSNNGTKATPALTADILGDWREEVIWRKSDSSALRIFTTIIPASRRLFTLMHDTQYRTAIAWQNVGYNQPPHPSYYLGTGMETPPQPEVYVASQTVIPGDFDQDTDVDHADLAVWQSSYGSTPTGGSFGDADLDGDADGTDYLAWQRGFTGNQSPATLAGLAGVESEPRVVSESVEGTTEYFAEPIALNASQFDKKPKGAKRVSPVEVENAKDWVFTTSFDFERNQTQELRDQDESEPVFLVGFDAARESALDVELESLWELF